MLQISSNGEYSAAIKSCLKANDIRGRFPDQINANIAFEIARRYAQRYEPRKVVVGWDIRLSSPEIAQGIVDGFRGSGVDVYCLGQVATELVYFSGFTLYKRGIDAGFMVTASHNPQGYNGIKIIGPNAKPFYSENGLNDLLIGLTSAQTKTKGRLFRYDIVPEYLLHIEKIVDVNCLSGVKIFINSGNGCGGELVEQISQKYCIPIIHDNAKPDGKFPNGVPNPLLLKCRDQTSVAMKDIDVDFGVAFDGDADRCFFFDPNGVFIESYYLIGLFCQRFIRDKNDCIIHDPRVFWNTLDAVASCNGKAVMSRTGHAHIKAKMRAEDAVYGGEMSGHHYFRDFGYCDSGMLPWLIISELIAKGATSIKDMIMPQIKEYPISGEQNLEGVNFHHAVEVLKNQFRVGCLFMDNIDGLSMSFGNWRFNLRESQTENLVRLNVESKGDRDLCAEKTTEIMEILTR